jgi:hypothetical protein
VPGTSCTTAYPAAPGWDAVSGLGTIKLQPFLDWHTTHLNAGTSTSGGAREKLSVGDDVGVAIGAAVLVGIAIMIALFVIHDNIRCVNTALPLRL